MICLSSGGRLTRVEVKFTCSSLHVLSRLVVCYHDSPLSCNVVHVSSLATCELLHLATSYYSQFGIRVNYYVLALELSLFAYTPD